jgi:hypothetical protein
LHAPRAGLERSSGSEMQVGLGDGSQRASERALSYEENRCVVRGIVIGVLVRRLEYPVFPSVLLS